MDPLMLTSIRLLAQHEGWTSPGRAPRPARLARTRRLVAGRLRALARRLEPSLVDATCEPIAAAPSA